MEKISNKYLLNILFSYIPFNALLNIIKKSKKYQKEFNISLFTYQSFFIFKKLKINYDIINIDKLINFIINEFKIKVDKNLLEKVIEEKKAEKAIIPINNLPINQNQEKKILNIDKDLTWVSDINIIKLDFSEIITNLEEQINIPSKLFPNLKVLNVNNNFIIPSSMIINLSELYISYKNTNNKLLFLNDIYKDEINLNNLEFLKILTYDKYKVSINKEEEETSIKLNNNNNIISKTNYNIVFHIKKIKHLIMDISSNCDNSFIEKYFDLNLLDLIESKPLNKKTTTFIDLINKKVNYFKMMSMKDLKYANITYRDQYNIINSYKRSFIMETTRNGLKKYYYSISHINEDSYKSNQICFEEIYEEKENKDKILIFYENCRDFNNIILTNIDNINAIRIDGNSRKINIDKINAIFDIKKNNYSLQEINLSFVNNGFIGENYYKTLIKNISKFKVLKKLFLFDHISIEKFKLFLDKISKLKLLEELYIKVDAKLYNNIKELKESIKKKFPLCKVEVYDFCFLRIEQNKKN